MKNKLELLDTPQGWIAVFSGETGSGAFAVEEQAHNIEGKTDAERTANALLVWGADAESTDVTIS